MAHIYVILDEIRIQALQFISIVFSYISILTTIGQIVHFKVLYGVILKILERLGLLDGGANGVISNGKNTSLMFFHPDDHCVNTSDVGNYTIKDYRLTTFCAIIEVDLCGLLCQVLDSFYNYTYIPEQVGIINCFK